MKEKKILVVDDEKDLRETIKMMLEAAGGYKVETASDGKEAVKKAHLVKPDLVILDIRMPEMDGLQTLKLLKESTATMAIPVVMLTALTDDIFRLKTSQLYDEDYITKPIRADELVARIEKVLERKKPIDYPPHD